MLCVLCVRLDVVVCCVLCVVCFAVFVDCRMLLCVVVLVVVVVAWRSLLRVVRSLLSVALLLALC